MYNDRNGGGGGTPNLAAARTHAQKHHISCRSCREKSKAFSVCHLLTHDVPDGPAIGEPPGGESGLVVDAVPGVIGLREREDEVVVVPDVGHRVAEDVDHWLLGCHRRGDAATAVAVALPATLATAAVEGLFQLRIARPYAVTGELTSSMVCEGFLIAYIYSIICVLDTVITCMVYQTCKMSHSCDLLELEEKGDLAA